MTGRILITGAAGFIGSNLAEALLLSGYRVVGIDNFDTFYDITIKRRNLEAALQIPGYEFLEGDVRDMGFLNRCFIDAKPDIVIHLAAKAGVRNSLLDPAGYYDVNVMGTLKLLETMKRHEVTKMIFASSSSVYGNNKKVPFSETDVVDSPISPYAATKRAGELLCYTYHHLYNFSIFCLRFFTVYGPRQRPDLAIHKFTKAILAGEEITLFGDGTTSRDYTHIEDILQGMIKAVEKVNGYEIFNLGESSAIPLIKLVRTLERSLDREARIKYMPMMEGDVFQTFADINKAKSKLDYNPLINFDTGIKDFIKWFRHLNK
jgi:UDP-glucuronate 4-epimerase